MSGIAGCCDFAGRRSPDLLTGMLAASRHRGAHADMAEVEIAGCAIGIGQCDRSPLRTQVAAELGLSGAAAVLDGALHNGHELRPHPDGPEDSPLGDRDLLQHAFGRWGAASFDKLIGELSFALITREEAKLYLVRDRWGVKPLFYFVGDGYCLFASDPRAFRAHPGFDARIDPDSVAAYFLYDSVPAPFSIFQGVRKVLPGHFLEIDLAKRAVREREYWHFTRYLNRPRMRASEDEAKERIEEALTGAIRARAARGAEVGAFLSGGYDSAFVSAVLQRDSPRPIKTFCVGFHEEGLDEAPDARRVAAFLGTEHREIYCTGGMARTIFPDLPEIYSEPVGIHSLVPTVLASRLAGRHADLALAGDGASTLIGPGDPARYFGPLDIYHHMLGLPRPLRSLLARIVRAARGRGGHRLAERLSARSPLDLFWAAGTAGQTYFPAGHLPKLLAFPFELRGGYFLDGNRLELDADRLEQLAAIVDLLDHGRSASDRMFVRVDQSAAAASLEVSLPFTDHRLVDLATALPAHLKYRRGTAKYVFKAVVHKYVPETVMQARKMGFESPTWQWLRTDLRDLVEEYLNPGRLQREGVFRQEYVARLTHRCLHEPDVDRAKLLTSWVRKILLFQMWLERWG